MRVALLALAFVGAAAAATTPTGVTFNKDVLPILQKNCQNCHRPGEAAPMSFLDYEHTRPWAKAIKTAVVGKQMPPWFADPKHGRFSNERRLDQHEIDTLVSWADSGAKQGNPKDAPAAVAFTDGWQISKPDYVIEMPKDFEIPASGTIDYQYIMIPSGLREDRWVQVAEARPGNRQLVHHIIAFIREPGNPWMKDAQPGIPFVPKKGARGQQDDSLVGYAPGVPPQVMQPGQAKLVKAGSDIILQMHYTANGTAGTDRSRIGLVFAKETPTERVMTLAAANPKFAIPPGDANYQVNSKLLLQHDSKLVSLLPHMHFRGKDFVYWATYPTGEKEIILNVPNYDFNWQLQYYEAEQKVLPKGTLIECTAHFDNSVNNRYNPDPTKEVHWGDQTWEEMMIGFLDVAVPLDVTMQDMVRPRRPAAATAGSGIE